MLKELKFVQGAVAKKDLIPALTHFVIEGGKVRGFNGTLALCSPIALDIACKPKALPLIAAINNCKDTVQLSLTPKGRLSIKSGAFKALVECVDGDTAHANPEGEHVALDGASLLNAMKVVEPFIGDDASRPWTNGVLLKGASAFATKNVTLIEYWVGTPFPHVVNIPRAAVREMVRINEAPTHAQLVPGSSMTFHYSDGRWVRTQLLSTEWPDLSKILDKPSTQNAIDTRLFEGLRTVKPFVDKMGRIYFHGGVISTHIDLEEGATYDVPDLHDDGVYNIEMLMDLEGVVQTIDFSAYPGACLFMGDRLRGAIIGIKK